MASDTPKHILDEEIEICNVFVSRNAVTNESERNYTIILSDFSLDLVIHLRNILQYNTDIKLHIVGFMKTG